MKFTVPEGTTPIDDISALRTPGILTAKDLNAAEAENILYAMENHLRRPQSPKKQWFSEKYIRQLHRDMFDRVWEWAGRYRHTEVNIGVSAHLIREEIAKLVLDVHGWKDTNLPVLERAVRLHHRLSRIHPFLNGNGRHARLMSDIYLFSFHLPRPAWPESKISAGGDTRKAYIHALHMADSGDIQPLMQLTEKLT